MALEIKTGTRAEFKAELWRDGKLVPEEKSAEPEERVLMAKVGDGVLSVKLIKKGGTDDE